MKTLIVIAAGVLLMLGGCTAQQSQDLTTSLDEAAKIRLTLDNSAIAVEKIRADKTLSEVEKIQKSVKIYSDAAVSVGLVPPEKAAGFMAGLDAVANAYLAFQPLGAAKMNWATLLILAWVAVRKKNSV